MVIRRASRPRHVGKIEGKPLNITTAEPGTDCQRKARIIKIHQVFKRWVALRRVVQHANWLWITLAK
jgi:hypothetical protein